MTKKEIIEKAREHAVELSHRQAGLTKLDDLSFKKLADLPRIRTRNALEVSFMDENDYPYITIILDSDSGEFLSGRQIPNQKAQG